jgi:hypothetical protein
MREALFDATLTLSANTHASVFADACGCQETILGLSARAAGRLGGGSAGSKEQQADT